MARGIADVPAEDVEAFFQGGQWMEAWLDHRRAGRETVVLAAAEDLVETVLVDPADGRLIRLTVPRSAGIPMPSRHGMGETQYQEAELSARYPELRWSAADDIHARGKGIFVYPLGPVRADVAESLLYRLEVLGDEMVHVGIQSGFKHRHIRELARGRTVSEAFPLIDRFTTTSTVHHALALAMAAEAAWEWSVPAEDHRTRTLLAELERLASHFGDLALLAASTGLTVPQMEYLHLKESVLRVNASLFGHRYLRGSVRPGGVNPDLWPRDADPVNAVDCLERVAQSASAVARDLEATPSFLDRLHGAGLIPPSTLETVRPVGPVGRAGGEGFDVRGVRPYAAYGALSLKRAEWKAADAYGRFRVRVGEVAESLKAVREIVAEWDPERIRAAAGGRRDPSDPPRRRRGLGIVEAPRGLLAYHLELDGRGRIRSLTVATPSARNWPTVPAALANGNILQDFPIVDASFALSVAGWDG